MALAISPTSYIAMLQAIPVSFPGGSAGHIVIRNYRCELMGNGGAEAGKQFVNAVVESSRRLHLDLASNAVGVDQAVVAANRDRNRLAARQHRPAPPPLHQSNLLDMRRAATGKATITQLRSVLTNLAIWIDHDGPARLGRVAWLERPSFWGMHEGRRYIGQALVDRLTGAATMNQKLQLIADTFFGFDCNGFVGTWLQLNGQPRNSESAIPDLFSESQAIENVGQLVPYMLIRFDGNLHVNVIESNAGSPNRWNVSGAEHGGIGTHPYTIQSANGQPKRFRVQGNGMEASAALIGPAEISGRRA